MKPDPRPKKRVKDRDAIRRYKLERMGDPCDWCEQRPGTDAHHVVFRSQGGDDHADNLAWLCRTCHDREHFG